MNSALVTTAEATGRRGIVAAAAPMAARFVRRLHVFFWVLAVALGLLHAWNGRYEVSPDGISYLDMGEAYLRGDWAMAVNGYWSRSTRGCSAGARRPQAFRLLGVPVGAPGTSSVYVAALCAFPSSSTRAASPAGVACFRGGTSRGDGVRPA